MSDRVTFAVETGGLALPDGPVALLGAPGGSALPPVDPSRITVIQRDAVQFARWQARGVPPVTTAGGPYAAVIVTLPRERDRAEARLAEACAAAPGGRVVVDGAKTDGVEAMLKALKARTDLLGTVSKAHGKVAWFEASDALSGWARPTMMRNAEGDMVAPGVFSAGAADPASRVLAAALPDTLKGRVADLGAGWGWLSREILRRKKVDMLHLVDADLPALDCARVNVADPRARFHWADAAAWTPDTPLDIVVTNPPFHAGRKADPSIGQTFIAAAARILAPHGQLWLVANRHLPYETAVTARFREFAEIAGDAKYKVLRAARPARPRR
jgi:16S rRNA (guanine1207-N2)-methyltransferase